MFSFPPFIACFLLIIPSSPPPIPIFPYPPPLPSPSSLILSLSLPFPLSSSLPHLLTDTRTIQLHNVFMFLQQTQTHELNRKRGEEPAENEGK